MAKKRLRSCRTVAESDGYRVLPGADDLLPRLLADGYLLGLVTGNTEAAASIKLHRAQLNSFFSFGGYGSDAADRNVLTRIALERAALTFGAEVSADEAIAVGDTPLDIESAHSAGIACVGVVSHKFTLDQAREAGADYPIASLDDGFPV